MRIEQKQLLRELSRSAHGVALREFLDEKLKDIGDVTKCESWEDTLGRRHAILLIRDLFSFLEEEKPAEKIPHQYS